MSGVPSEHKLTCNGIQTRYLEAGKNHPESIVFIHGLGSSADRWLDIPLALSLQYHTIAVDLPGFGMAEKPEEGFGYSIPEYASFVAQLIRDLGMGDRKTHFVGHSLGGYIAAEVAIQHKSLVNKLVLVDTSGMLNGPTELLQKYLSAAMDPTRESVRGVFEKLVAVPSRIPDILVDGFVYRMKLPGAKNAFRLAYENSVNTQIGNERLQKISGIQTLIIWGREDRLIPLDYHSIFHSAIANSRIVLVDDAGHAPFAEKPALTCELIRRFLEMH
ncbi:MAG: alpha/beta fold hydrolase [Nitrososphaera sp.]